MKFINDIYTSITGNAKARINDQFIGAFVCSWIIFNWNHISLLFWGEGKAFERINVFHSYLTETKIIAWNSLFIFPLIMASFYLFIFPWISFFINFTQRRANEKLHKQAINTELTKIENQQKLNKEKLKSNPNKPFLAQLVQQDIEKRNVIITHMELRTSRLQDKNNREKDKAREQELKTLEAENAEKISRLEIEKRKKQSVIEKIKFENDSAKAKAAQASNRFPSAYYFLIKINEYFSESNIKISLNSLSLIISSLFGYEDFEELLNDKNFNNETLGKVKYIYYDDELAKRFEQIVSEEDSDDTELSANIIFECIEILFDDMPYKLISGDNLAEECREEFERSPYGIFDDDGVSGAIAESNTTFEEVDDINIEDFNFNNGFYADLSAYASGYHYREEGVPGRTMSISITMQCEVLVGKFGLGSIEQGKVSGTLDEFD